MKSLHARGIALALASCWLIAPADAQQAPYGAPAPQGAVNGPEFTQPYGDPAVAYGQASADAQGLPYPPGYQPQLGRQASRAHEPAFGAGLRPQSPSWLTGTRLQQPTQELSAQPTPAAPLLETPPPQKNFASPYADPEWQAAPWADKGAEACDVPASCAPGPNWFASFGGLVMTRDNENDVWLSYDTNNIQNRVLTTRDASMDWSGGFETRFGRYLGCGNKAVEAVYWGLFPNVREANAYDTDVAGDLNSILHFDQIEYDPGTGSQPVSNFFFQAERHRLLRSYQFHNVELNLLSCCTEACQGPQFGWTAGVRYFRFDEGFQYATDPSDVFLNGDPDEVAYMVNVVNNLVGFQVGGRLDYVLGQCWSVYADTKVGLYGNHIRHRSQISGANGDAVVVDPGGPFDASILCVDSTKDDVAMIGELSLGGVYRLTNCWSINAGYRAVAISGLALSTNQIPVDYISDIDSLRAIDSNGSMILHGAYGGLQYNW